MSMKLVATFIAAVAALAIAGTAAAAPATVGPSVLPKWVETDLFEHGLTWAGKRHTVLDAGCVGVGYPGRPVRGDFGIVEKTYRKFQCYVTVDHVPDLELITVTMRPGYHYVWVEV